MPTETLLSILLGATAALMAALGLISLSRRRMRWTAYLGWGLLAVCVPLLGPFLVMAFCPREPRPEKEI